MPLDGEYAPETTGWVSDQLAIVDRTGTTEAVQMGDRRIVVFTVRGRRSGLLRRVPLMRVEHDGKYAAVASKGGAARHPSWYFSMRANPQVTVQDGTETRDAVARLLTGDEREQWWTRAVESFPPYAEYQVRTARQIPVLLIEPS